MGVSGLYLKNPSVVEKLSTLTHILFDKTGTLTPSSRPVERFDGIALTDYEKGMVGGLAAHSTHPLSRAISAHLGKAMMPQVTDFNEFPGEGIGGEIAGHTIRLGQPDWVSNRETILPDSQRSIVALSIDHEYRGRFLIARGMRGQVEKMVHTLAGRYKMAVLSGDNETERERLDGLFEHSAELHFNQSPHDKLEYVSKIETGAQVALMVGDGLNDAGALRAASVGMALSEDTAAFSPACDAIMEAENLGMLPNFLNLARGTRNVIIASVGLSFIYNLLGLSLAVSGHLSPLLAAILMPLSSISVVTFATLSVRWFARRKGVRK
jgi:Cu+-exporting ATPase